jgi:proteasome lid subunit RPN8/RPN11
MTRDDSVNLISIRKELVEDLIRLSVEALPEQAYGLVGGKDVHHPSSVYPCSTNLRNTPKWKALFESYGDFYRDPSRGFVISPDEFLEIWYRMRSVGESFIGVLHSHRWHGPVPTRADTALHVDSKILSFIVSVVTPDRPELKIYRLFESHYEDVPFQTV